MPRARLPAALIAVLRERLPGTHNCDLLPRAAHVPSFRLFFERHLFSVTGSATLIREESDQDLHVVLRSGKPHLIAEAPKARLHAERSSRRGC
jgi:hypothetical protein